MAIRIRITTLRLRMIGMFLRMRSRGWRLKWQRWHGDGGRGGRNLRYGNSGNDLLEFTKRKSEIKWKLTRLIISRGRFIENDISCPNNFHFSITKSSASRENKTKRTTFTSPFELVSHQSASIRRCMRKMEMPIRPCLHKILLNAKPRIIDLLKSVRVRPIFVPKRVFGLLIRWITVSIDNGLP